MANNLGCKPLQEASARHLRAPALLHCIVIDALGLSTLLKDMGKAHGTLYRLAELSPKPRPSAVCAAEYKRRTDLGYCLAWCGVPTNNQWRWNVKGFSKNLSKTFIAAAATLLAVPSSSPSSFFFTNPRALEIILFPQSSGTRNQQAPSVLTAFSAPQTLISSTILKTLRFLCPSRLGWICTTVRPAWPVLPLR